MAQIATVRRVCRHFDRTILNLFPELADHAASLLGSRYLASDRTEVTASDQFWLRRASRLELLLPYWRDAAFLALQLGPVFEAAPGLREASLEGDGLPRLDVGALVQLPLAKLASLALRDLMLEQRGAAAWGPGRPVALRELMLVNVCGSAEVLTALLVLVTPALRRLQLRSAELRVTRLAAMPWRSLCGLVELDVSHNWLGEATAAAIPLA